ncbi:hypothetical protein [Microbacterium esteraromaticum]|uniref:hypothetical protein n=1 Tax=Microbacterium esteraromaticum TaxID=57043 RepID=UPI0019D36FD1|nr:hypothetical protein [Microbacterium esteraromaticum]MBN7793501.1 hypothetical protein [Microbacterium esteraromaticum]
MSPDATVPTTEGILRAAAEWAWFPRGSEHEVSELQLVRYPARFGGGVRASRVASDLDAPAVLDHAIERTREWGETRLTFWTNAADSPDLEAELVARGAEHVDTVAVLARPVDGISIEVPEGISAEVIRTLDHVREMDAVDVAVWQEQQPLSPEQLTQELTEIESANASGEGIRVLARIDGVAVSTGGCTIVGEFARLWGGGTVPEARGRGAYLAVLAERLRRASALGATTALVKGRVSTSAPILTRAGFVHYGDERGYTLNV